MRIILINLRLMNSIPTDTASSARHVRMPSGIPLGYRAGVAARALAAIGGGYLLASTSTTLLALVLPLSPVDRVVAATLTGLAIYPCAAMWSFAAASAVRAWLGLGGACTVVALALLALRTAGGGA
jgi:hypothetical protein